MPETALVLATLGALLLLGLLTDALGRLTPLPRVTLLVVFGMAIGPAGFGLLPAAAEEWYPLVSNVALVMVGFLLGGKLSRAALRRHGRMVLAVSLAEVAGVALAVGLGLIALGVPLQVALLLAGIAPASAPAAITSVVRETRARGRFTTALLGIVALDDAWGLVVFSLLLAAAQVAAGGGGGLAALGHGLWELAGALALGAALGLPAAYLTGRIRKGEPMLSEALGLVLLVGGLAQWLEVSFLLAAMALGAVVVNLARHHERPFHEIEHIEWPFMVLFFVLAGARLHLEALAAVGAIGAAYVALRAAGLVAGAWAGGRLAEAKPAHCRWMGLAIMPQAGVALGMALVAANAFPGLADTVLPVVIASTVVFELAGPLLTRLALVRVGEARAGRRG